MDKSALSDRERLAPIIKSTNQRAVIIELAKLHKWKLGAEIGVLRGKTLFSVLMECPNLAMYGIDQWKQLPFRDVDCSETYKQFDMELLYNKVLQASNDFGSRCMIIRDTSINAAHYIENEILDFVFIDADHTYEGVKQDIDTYYPKVKIGGMILGHDNHWPTVKRAIDERFPNWVDYGEAVWGIYK